jgi:hypothetical protein
MKGSNYKKDERCVTIYLYDSLIVIYELSEGFHLRNINYQNY